MSARVTCHFLSNPKFTERAWDEFDQIDHKEA